MKEKSIKRNYLYNVTYQVLILIIPLITMPYVSRVLTANGVGAYSYGTSISTYFVIAATLGTTAFGQRAISYVQGDIYERSRAFWELVIFRAVTVLLSLGAYFILFSVTLKNSGTLYLILALNVVNVFFDISWFFQGLEEFGRIVLRNLIFKFLNLAAIFIFVRTVNDLNKYALILTGFTLLGNISLWPMLKGKICKVKGLKPFKDLKVIIQFFIPTVAIQVYAVLDKSMIGWFTGSDAENGFYSQAETIAKVALTAVTSLGTVMTPRIARYFKEGNFGQMCEYLYKSYRFTFLLAVPMVFGIVAVASTLVPIFLGDGYEPSIRLLQLFSLLVLFIGLSNVNGMQLFIPTGRQNMLTLTVTAGAVVNVILNLIFIPKLAATGACIATVIAEAVVAAVGFVIIAKLKILNVGKVFLTSWKYLIAGGVMFCVVNFAVKPFVGVSISGLALLILSGIVSYFLMLLLLRDALFFEAIKSVKKRLFRKNSAIEQ